MRCSCCNVILTPQECVRKFRDSGEFTDTCTKCLRDIPVATVEGASYDEDFIDHTDQPFDDEDLDEV